MTDSRPDTDTHKAGALLRLRRRVDVQPEPRAAQPVGRTGEGLTEQPQVLMEEVPTASGYG
jgi:hypothetical protein